MPHVQHSAVSSSRIPAILEEAWDRFYPSILWWADKAAATDPKNARTVYRELLSGPAEGMSLARELHSALAAEHAG